MKRVLFATDSYFQLIIALNLRTTIYADYDADIIIYDSVPSASQICRRLRECNVFSNVYHAVTSLTRCGRNYSFVEKVPKYFVYLFSLLFPKFVLRNIAGNIVENSYDDFVFNSYGALCECIFNVCYKNNKSIKCSRFEDGFPSYFTLWGSSKGKYRRLLESMFFKLGIAQNIENYIDKIYFEEPDLVLIEFPYKIVASPKFGRSNKKMIDTLNYIFDYDPNSDSYDKDIYLFEDGRLFFDGNDEEVDIVSNLIKYVPKDRIIIKMHPRRKENRFKHLDISSMKAATVPWELIQLNKDFSGCFFITAASSIAFSSDVYFGDKCHKILLYNCMKTPPSTIDYRFKKYLEAFRNKYGNDIIFIPETYQDLAKYIMFNSK